MMTHQPLLVRPLAWVFVRGESHREGQRFRHDTSGSQDTLRSNMLCYLHHLVAPLEAKGLGIVVCGDLRTAGLLEEETENAFKSGSGRRVQYIRVQAELLGENQLGSFTSAWGGVRYQLRIRRQAEAIVRGVRCASRL